jgi:hypothetical protein
MSRDIPQHWRFILVAGASFILSAVGIAIGVYEKCPADGERGGALATAIAFAALFVRPDYGLRIYEERKRKIPADLPKNEQLVLEVDAIAQALKLNSKGQKYQNYAIAAASLIGTIIWGFGDLVVSSLIKFFPHT